MPPAAALRLTDPRILAARASARHASRTPCPALLRPCALPQADVHSIVDHHKLCGLKTSKPLDIDIRPLCSAGSILYTRAKAAGRKPPKKIAALMLSCILYDSLEFRR